MRWLSALAEGAGGDRTKPIINLSYMRLKEIKVKWIQVIWVCFGIKNLFNNEATAQTEKKCLGRGEGWEWRKVYKGQIYRALKRRTCWSEFQKLWLLKLLTTTFHLYSVKSCQWKSTQFKLLKRNSEDPQNFIKCPPKHTDIIKISLSIFQRLFSSWRVHISYVEL